MRVIAIYDNREKSTDRYTVLTDAYLSHPSGSLSLDTQMYLGMAEGGRGVSEWGELPRGVYATLLKPKTNGYKVTTHLGHLVPFESLSNDTQKHIARRVLGDE